MIPVTQTKMGFPSGNCMEAAMASILEIHLSEMPDLGDTKGDEGDEWRAILGKGLKELGFWFLDVSFPDSSYMNLIIPEGAFVLMNGKNPDGIAHSVVGQKLGPKIIMIHDPNPSRRGIGDIESIGVLVPINPTTNHQQPRPNND